MHDSRTLERNHPRSRRWVFASCKTETTQALLESWRGGDLLSFLSRHCFFSVVIVMFFWVQVRDPISPSRGSA